MPIGIITFACYYTINDNLAVDVVAALQSSVYDLSRDMIIVACTIVICG